MTDKSLLLRTKIQNAIIGKGLKYMHVCLKEDIENHGTYVRIYKDVNYSVDCFISDLKQDDDIKSLISYYSSISSIN